MVRFNLLHTNRRFRSVVLLAILFFWAQQLFATIPTGYYNNAAGKSGAALKTALHKIIRGHTRKTYGDLWGAFYLTDDKPNGTVWDIYSDIPNGTPNGNPPYVYYFGTNQCSNTPGYENGCYNREHSFPSSWFDGNEGDTTYSDLFHLYPTDSYVNTRRNNYPFGQVGTATWTSLNGSKLGICITPGYSSTVFEPRNEFKGDLARTYFYMATRYESGIASWETENSMGDSVMNGTSYPCYETWFLNMLLAWNAQDPVSQKEIDRNNEIHTTYQHNRNPFIDHPEYAASIWTLSTLAATNVTSSGATLNGIVNPNGVATNYKFEWGLTPTYGYSSNPTSVGAGSDYINVNTGITGLEIGATYHYRLVIDNSNGIAYGNDLTLTTISPTLGVAPSNQNVTSSAGSTSFTVTSNSAWTATSNQSWCTVTPSGTGNGIITGNYSANPTTSQRVANVTVTVSGLSPIVVMVTQAGSALTLSVTPSDQPVTAPLGNTSFSVTSNTNWTATSNQSWCAVTPSGSGNGTITASYLQNTTVSPRVANVTVTVTGLTPVVVTVTQAAADPALLVTPSNQNVTKFAGITAFTVTSNTVWAAGSNQTWCTCTPSGNGNGSIDVNYSENVSSSSRVADITVTVSGLLPVVVTVTQEGSLLPPEPTNFPTNFSAYNIILHWTDATGAVLPHGYLMRMSSVGFDSIPVPVDGVSVSNSDVDKNVASGVQQAWFTNLTPNTVYYFKIFGYQGSGSSIDYKTDGEVPQVHQATLPAAQ